MTINEDFFDEINSDDISVYNDNLAAPNYSKYKYKLYGTVPDSCVRNFSKTHFEKVLDSFVYIEYAVEYSEDKYITVHFNHSLKTIKQYLDFIICLYNATKQKIDEWVCNSDDKGSYIYMPTIMNRYTNPISLCYSDSIEAKRILRVYLIVK